MSDRATTAQRPHAEVMRELKDRLLKVRDVIGGGAIHFVDVPIHSNIGDLLILFGTLRFFRENRAKVAMSGAYFNYEPSWAKAGDVIVFQGGGNLGDLYPDCQLARERIVRALPKNRIVVLPQTIHFQEAESYERCCKVFAEHADLHVFVRDKVSEGLALGMTPNVYRVPDMAHFLWPLGTSSHRAGFGSLALRRTDDEIGPILHGDFERVIDWEDVVGNFRSCLIRGYSRLGKVLHYAKSAFITRMYTKVWIRIAGTLVSEAVEAVSQYDRVTTNRLHGHILSSLICTPNSVIDNSYGKNIGYVDAWTGESDLVQLSRRSGTA